MGEEPRFKTFYAEADDDEVDVVTPIISPSFAESIKGRQVIKTPDGTIVEEEIPLVRGEKITGRYGKK